MASIITSLLDMKMSHSFISYGFKGKLKNFTITEKEESVLHRKLYSLARKINKVATIINDARTWSTGDPKKIAKRYARKSTYKTTHGAANKIARAIIKAMKFK